MYISFLLAFSRNCVSQIGNALTEDKSWSLDSNMIATIPPNCFCMPANGISWEALVIVFVVRARTVFTKSGY